MWPAHQPRRITLSLEKLCPVHRGPIAMSGRVAQVRPIKLGVLGPGSPRTQGPRRLGVPNNRGPQEANSASLGGGERCLLVGVREAIFARRGEGTALRPWGGRAKAGKPGPFVLPAESLPRSEEHTSELQSRQY